MKTITIEGKEYELFERPLSIAEFKDDSNVYYKGQWYEPVEEEWPRGNESYFFIDKECRVMEDNDWPMVVKDLKKAENIFRTKEEAQHISDIQRTERKHIRLLKEINDGWVPDWSDAAQKKGRVVYLHNYATLVVNRYYELQTLPSAKHHDVEKDDQVLEMLKTQFTPQERAWLGLGPEVEL